MILSFSFKSVLKLHFCLYELMFRSCDGLSVIQEVSTASREEKVIDAWLL